MARYNRFMGEYDPNTEYQKGDVVTFEGAAWYRKVAGKGISPIAVKKPYMVWSRMNDDLSTVFPLGGTGGASFAQTYTDMTPGYVSVKTGAFGTGGNWQRTDYIPVSSGDVVTFSGRIGDSMGVAGYDENKAFVASVLDRINLEGGYTYENEPLTIPDGVAYIAGCTISGAYPITVMVYKDAKVLTETVLPQNPGAYKYMATDGEGEWVPADRLAYKAVEEKVIVPEQTVNFPYDNATVKVTANGTFVEGAMYTVCVDGVQYERTAEAVSSPFVGVIVGKHPGFGGNDTFTFAYNTNNGQIMAIIDGTGDHTFSVAEHSETIHPVPAEYLPAGFVPTAVIKSSDYDNALAGVAAAAAEAATYECTNMTFEEAWAIVASGKPLNAVTMEVADSVFRIEQAVIIAVPNSENGPLLVVSGGNNDFEWTASGLIVP